MGHFLFDIPDDWNIQSRQAGTVHVVGLDGIPWPCKVNFDGRTLLITRNRDESGHIYVSFPFKEHGEIVVATGTLPESPQHYCLVTELARGTANRLRNQISIWQEGGLNISDDVHTKTQQAVKLLGAAILKSDKKSKCETARESLEVSMSAIFQLSKEFGDQIVPVRKSQATEARFWLAARCGHDLDFDDSVNCKFADLIQIPCEEIHRAPSKPTILGPFLNAAPFGMTDKLQALDDFEARKAHALGYAREILKDVPPSVKLIHAVSGLNGTGHRHLSYPQQLQLTIEIIQAIEDSANDLPVMVSFDFPWAERLAWSVGGTHPLQIADSLLRRGVKIAMLGLDINLDYWPGGSAIRDPLQWIELVDIWSQLGLPLVICFRVPNGTLHDDPEGTVRGQVNLPRTSATDELRIKFLNIVIPMLIARPTVHGIIWRQWSDRDDSRYPCGGLVDQRGEPKIMMDFWNSIRGDLLN